MIQNQLLINIQINTDNNTQWHMFKNYSKEVKSITTCISSHPS